MSRIVNDLKFGSRNLLCQRRVGGWCCAAIIQPAYDDSGAVDLVEIRNGSLIASRAQICRKPASWPTACAISTKRRFKIGSLARAAAT